MALKSVLREDPNVVLVGEMRDYETIASALTIAETGHLVFATLHTNSAAQTIDRIIDVFPENQQAQVRNQLASSLEAVFAQRLVPSVEGKRIPVVEVLLASSAVRSNIREGKTHQIDNIIQTSGAMGMMTFEASLVYWAKAGVISPEKAREYALRPEEFDRAFKQ
jgi:twitching motility protein PilT